MHVHILCFITEIDLKKASKTFAQHFSCGSAVTGDDEIVIQGDVGYDVIDFIQEKWPDVSRNVLYNYYVVCAWSRNGNSDVQAPFTFLPMVAPWFRSISFRTHI